MNKWRYEFWPWWLFFIPLLPLWLYYALRTRTLFYFTNVNPKIDLGGFFGESKIEILNDIPDQYKAQTWFFLKGTPSQTIAKTSKEAPFSYPVIAKPDVGERGQDVKKIKSLDELTKYASNLDADFIVQEFIDYPVECGLFYARLPEDNKGKVTSLTLKSFLTVKGDGKSTIQQLVHDDARGRFYADLYPLDEVLRAGEERVIQPIGNHSLGTEFINGNAHITSEMSATFDQVCEDIPEFYYGRFDLKVPNMHDLQQGKNIKIFELNGVSSEPGHIYDRTYTVFKAYRDLAKHWNLIYKISKQNKARGYEAASVGVVLHRIRQHFFM